MSANAVSSVLDSTKIQYLAISGLVIHLYRHLAWGLAVTLASSQVQGGGLS